MFVGEHRWISEPRDPSYCYIVTSMDPQWFTSTAGVCFLSHVALCDPGRRAAAEIGGAMQLVAGVWKPTAGFLPFFFHIFLRGDVQEHCLFLFQFKFEILRFKVDLKGFREVGHMAICTGLCWLDARSWWIWLRLVVSKLLPIQPGGYPGCFTWICHRAIGSFLKMLPLKPQSP